MHGVTQQGLRTLTTIVGFSKSPMGFESRFLLRDAILDEPGSWFNEAVELGVKTPDFGRVASDEGNVFDGGICRRTWEAVSMSKILEGVCEGNLAIEPPAAGVSG